MIHKKGGEEQPVNDTKQNGRYRTFYFSITNDLEKDTTYYFKGEENSYITLILTDNMGKVVSRQVTGYNQPVQLRFGQDEAYFLPLAIAAGQTLQAQVILKGFFGRAANPQSYLYTPMAYVQYGKEAASYHNTQDFIITFYVGGILMLLLFFWFMYIESRQPLYNRYAFYLMLQWVYGILKLGPHTLVGYQLLRLPVVKFIMVEPVVLAAVGGYAWFVIVLLDLQSQHPKLSRLLKGLAIGLWTYSVLFAIVMLLNPFATFWIPAFGIIRLLLMTVNIGILLFIAIRVKSPVKEYFLFGNFLFLLFAFIAGLKNYIPFLEYGYLSRLTVTTWYMTGILLECIFFALALGVRIRELQQTKQESDQLLIEQMQMNEKLHKEATDQLELKVTERTEKIKRQAKQLEEVRLQETRADYERQLSEIRMQALRSRMNPHFIFNSLNSIKYFILKKENETAEFYLNKFSRLLRLILDYTTYETISLQQELEALNVYLEIESVRFDKSFHYHIHVDESVDTEKVRIPPLLLQPFVENAIWHGLANSDKDEKYCFVDIIRQNGHVLMQITDNGVGRAEAARINTNKPCRHISHGIKITEDRIVLFNNTTNSNINIQVQDNVEADATPAGTTVNITFQNPSL